MKAIFKLFPVALVAIALASCSNDDFIKEGEYTPSKNSIALYIDNGAVTRTGVQETAEGNHFAWTKGDVIKLYGVNQVKTNKYVVKSTPDFVQGTASYDKAGIATYADLEGEDVIGTELAYAMYPGTDENFFNSEYFRQFEMQLPAEWTYQILGTDKNVFYADFPMWGVATDNNTKVSFKYTTSFLRLDLSGLSASATAKIIITADKQLNGRFTADLYDGAGKKVELPALKPADKLVDVNVSEIIDGATLASVYNAATGLYDNIAGLSDAQKRGFALQQVTVNLNNLSNNDSRIIYLPIPVQNYGKLNIVLYYPEENRTDVIFDKPLDLTTDTRGIGWFGNMKREFSVTDQFYFPSDINQELFDNRENANTLNYKSDVVMAVDPYDASNPGKSTILMPAMATDQVILNFISDEAAAINGPANTLYIKDRDASAPFTKKLVINTKSIDVNTININLPSAEEIVLIGGNAATTKQYGNIVVKGAKKVTFGDNETATELKTSTTVSVTDAVQDAAEVAILGKAVVNKLVMNNAAAKLTVGAVKDAETNTYYDKATVKEITFSEDAPTVVVQGNGQINKLISTFTPAGGAHATGSVTTSGAANIIEVTKNQNFNFNSTWDGISNVGNDGGNIYTAAQLARMITTPVNFNLLTNVDLNNKFWAGIPAAAITIVGTNNYDSKAVTEGSHTISNLNLSGDATSGIEGGAATTDYTIEGLGFIKTATGAVSVTNLNVNGVKCQLPKYNASSTTTNKKLVANGIGALVGKASAAVTMTNVAVTINGDFGYVATATQVAAHEIGGFIGNAQDDVTLTKCKLDGTANFVGYYNIGGFVGGQPVTDKAVSIGVGDGNACSVKFTGFTVGYDNGRSIDKNYARVGGFVGSVGTLNAETGTTYYIGTPYTSDKTVQLVGTVDATVTFPTTENKNKIMEGTAPDFDFKDFVRGTANKHIGFIGDKIAEKLTVKIGNQTMSVSLSVPTDENKPKNLYWFVKP